MQIGKRGDWGPDHVFTSCSCTSGKKGTDALESALRVDLKYLESSLLLTGSSMLEGGRKQSSGKETGEWGDRWVWRRSKKALPPPGEGGPTNTANQIAAGPRNVRSRTRPAPPRRGPGPGRGRSKGDDPAVRLVPRRSYILKPSRIQGEVEDSDVIVAGIAFILSRARHICMLCDNWPVIWTGVSQ